MDIPKTRQYDTGKIEVIARSSIGETLATTELKVIPRKDDYRGVLKNSPRRMYILLLTYNTSQEPLSHYICLTIAQNAFKSKLNILYFN